MKLVPYCLSWLIPLVYLTLVIDSLRKSHKGLIMAKETSELADFDAFLASLGKLIEHLSPSVPFSRKKYFQPPEHDLVEYHHFLRYHLIAYQYETFSYQSSYATLRIWVICAAALVFFAATFLAFPTAKAMSRILLFAPITLIAATYVFSALSIKRNNRKTIDLLNRIEEKFSSFLRTVNADKDGKGA